MNIDVGSPYLDSVPSVPIASTPIEVSHPQPVSDNAASAVLFVRVTPAERDSLHDSARKQNASLNSYLRGVLGLPTRRGYRRRTDRGAMNATQENQSTGGETQRLQHERYGDRAQEPTRHTK